jgi:hypothetical protein
VDPIPDSLLFFLVVPGIEPGPPDLQPRTLTTRPQRRSSPYKRSEKPTIQLKKQRDLWAPGIKALNVVYTLDAVSELRQGAR